MFVLRFKNSAVLYISRKLFNTWKAEFTCRHIFVGPSFLYPPLPSLLPSPSIPDSLFSFLLPSPPPPFSASLSWSDWQCFCRKSHEDKIQRIWKLHHWNQHNFTYRKTKNKKIGVTNDLSRTLFNFQEELLLNRWMAETHVCRKQLHTCARERKHWRDATAAAMHAK